VSPGELIRLLSPPSKLLMKSCLLIDVATACMTQKKSKKSESAFAFVGLSQLVLLIESQFMKNFNVDDANNSEADYSSLYRFRKRHKRSIESSCIEFFNHGTTRTTRDEIERETNHIRQSPWSHRVSYWFQQVSS
jgi:hypothetical protein